MESESGMSMDDVEVHYNSPLPAQESALAYAQGNQIHVGSGQERHLAHEAWHVVQQKQGRVRPSVLAKRRTLVNDDQRLEREADRMGERAARIGRAALAAASIRDRTDLAHRRAPARAVQLKAPAGWRNDDETTWQPDAYSEFNYSIVTDALSSLDLAVESQRLAANRWASKALSNGMVGLGDVRSTYKSSYDQDPDAFSVSQNVPWIDQLVVHAHISSDDVVALDGGVNLKWKTDEGGMKAAKVPSSIGAGIIDVSTARDHWEANPGHDAAEENAEDLATGQAIFDLFDTSKQDALDRAAKKESDTQLVNWGWKKTIDKKKYGVKLTAARSDPDKMEAFLQMLRDAQARKAAEAAAAAGPP